MEKQPFSGPLRPDYGNTARAATVRLGSIGISYSENGRKRNQE